MEEKYDEIGKIVALPTFIKRINQVWFTPSLAAESLSFEDDYSDESFSSFGSFSDDDFLQDDDFASFGSFGEDDFTSEFDSFSSLADEEELADDMVNPDYVDPNIIYSQRLSSQVTMAQVADWINQAYIAAGGKNATTAEIVKYLEKELNYNGAAYYEIPYNYKKYPTKDLQGVVNGYLQLLSGSLDRFIGKADPLSPISTRMQVQLRTHSTELVGVIISDVKQYAKMYFPEGYTLEATGTGEMEHTMTSMVISSQISALLISLLCVFIIIAVSFKSPLAGVVGALPLAFAILLNYMAMGFAHINLDLITSIIASVAVGIGIDYTIHFLTTYREERAKSTDIVTVTKTVFSKSGHGIITNAIAVGLGFLVLCFSKFDVLRCIGALVAVVMFTSAGLAMTIIPGILNIYEPNFIRPKEEILKEKEEEEQNN